MPKVQRFSTDLVADGSPKIESLRIAPPLDPWRTMTSQRSHRGQFEFSCIDPTQEARWEAASYGALRIFLSREVTSPIRNDIYPYFRSPVLSGATRSGKIKKSCMTSTPCVTVGHVQWACVQQSQQPTAPIERALVPAPHSPSLSTAAFGGRARPPPCPRLPNLP